jgi:hypothetical protein
MALCWYEVGLWCSISAACEALHGQEKQMEEIVVELRDTMPAVRMGVEREMFDSSGWGCIAQVFVGRYQPFVLRRV